MATRNPGSGPVSLLPVSNKLQNKVNLLREVIASKKLEVRRVSKEMRDLIEREEERIIRELDAIWEEANLRIDNKKKETKEKIEAIEAQKKKLVELLKDLDLDSVETGLPQISERIDSVRREMSVDTPYVKLGWRIDELKEAINRMCRCEEQIVSYQIGTPYQLKWSGCEKGDGDNQIDIPYGIATNSMNGNVFVADYFTHKIQIFSKEGEWIRSVKDVEMKFPENILFLNQSIYVQCSRVILKLNESTEKKEKYKSYGLRIGGICSDKNHIYVGTFEGMSLLVLNLDLMEENRITLQTQFCNKEKSEIRDISLAQEVFYVLLTETDYPIQSFSREGVLTRCVVRKESIGYVCCFCLDQQLNIIVADSGYSKVKIFSNEGKLLTQFGEKGSEKGQFSGLRGISVDELGCVVTVDCRANNMLQAYQIIF